MPEQSGIHPPINDLPNLDEVYRTVFEASYLVMGLGDVYLGAPVATPLDPRHRLVTTKYNPARTWTAENSVGIGGAYMCVYGMEGPGGYQFVGRTLQMWNRYRAVEAFGGQPWLLRSRRKSPARKRTSCTRLRWSGADASATPCSAGQSAAITSTR